MGCDWNGVVMKLKRMRKVYGAPQKAKLNHTGGFTHKWRACPNALGRPVEGNARLLEWPQSDERGAQQMLQISGLQTLGESWSHCKCLQVEGSDTISEIVSLPGASGAAIYIPFRMGRIDPLPFQDHPVQC